MTKTIVHHHKQDKINQDKQVRNNKQTKSYKYEHDGKINGQFLETKPKFIF